MTDRAARATLVRRIVRKATANARLNEIEFELASENDPARLKLLRARHRYWSRRASQLS